jgi:hypothetical protein
MVGARYVVQDEARTNFLLDWWTGDAPLKDAFPALCHLQ